MLFFFFNLKTNQIFFFHFKISGIQLGMILISWEERRNHLFLNLNTMARGAEKKKQVETGCSIHCQCQQEVVTLDLPAKPKTPCQRLNCITQAGGYTAELTTTQNLPVDLRGQIQNRSGVLHTYKWKHHL